MKEIITLKVGSQEIDLRLSVSSGETKTRYTELELFNKLLKGEITFDSGNNGVFLLDNVNGDRIMATSLVQSEIENGDIPFMEKLELLFLFGQVKGDFQLDKLHKDYCGFLNIDGENWIGSAMEKGYKVFCEKYNMSKVQELMDKEGLTVEANPTFSETIFHLKD